MDLLDRILELSGYGYFCSEILALLALETIGEEDPGWVKAMGGLNGGVGYSQGCCGCLTGGCCVISYFTGKSSEALSGHPAHKAALGEFVDWYTQELLVRHGSTDCEGITRGNPAKRVEVCPELIALAYEKAMELLEEKGVL